MTNAGEPAATCALCGRPEHLTRHHLVPRTRHRKARRRGPYTAAELHRAVILVCRPCHSHIHRVLSEKELERGYADVEALRSHPEIRRFVHWIADKPPGFRPKAPSRRR